MLSSTCLALLGMGVVWTVGVGVRGQGECEEEGLHRTVSSCFTSHGLTLAATRDGQDATPGGEGPGQLLRQTQAINPEAQCRQKEKYKAATKCTLAALKKCMAVAGMEGAIPDVTRFQKGVDVVCDRQDDLDTECLKRQYPDILRCGERTVKALAHGNQGDAGNSLNHIICLSAEVHYDCATQHLKACDEVTTEIFLQQLDQYHVPTVCINRSPGRPGRKRHHLISGGKALHSAVFSVASGLAAVISLSAILLH
ncbi:uncharacterized protein LOC143275207 [Babylonia areolata]|uniref:uncharacterized protein LOC143275207 n=1 Tax=Babylonia areolata TaxID=304850 RepID=UPI003FD1AAF1